MLGLCGGEQIALQRSELSDGEIGVSCFILGKARQTRRAAQRKSYGT